MSQKSRPFQVRDLRNHGFWVADDVYLNGYAKHLDVYATAVYISLCRHAGKKQSCFPSQELIAKEHNISVRTVIRKIKLLEDWNLISRKKEKDENGRWERTVYYLLDKSIWKPLPGDTESHGEPHDSHDKNQVTQSHTKDTHKKDTHIIPKGITRKPRAEYGNPEINSLIKFFKERFGLPMLDGSEQQNRRYCHLAIVKFGGADKVRLLIETAANSDFWSTKISSFMDLYYKGVRIINETRSNKGVGVIS